MANVTPTIPVRGFPSSSFNIPANFTNRGTGNVGTNSAGVCTVRPGACGSALTTCCACIPCTPKPRQKNKPIPAHLMVRFMGAPPSPAAEGRNSDFLSGQPVACFQRIGTIKGSWAMTRGITRTLLWAQYKVNLRPSYLLHRPIAIAAVVLHREDVRRTQSQSLGTSFL